MKRLLEVDTALTDNSIIKINAGGGPIIMTTLSTLTKTFPQSMIARLFSRPELMPRDEQGNFFIDTDHAHFRAILNVLRRPDLLEIVPQHIDQETWLRTLDYFGLKDYVEEKDASILFAKNNDEHAIKVILFEYCIAKNLANQYFNFEISGTFTDHRRTIRKNYLFINFELGSEIKERDTIEISERDNYTDLVNYIDDCKERFIQYFQRLLPTYTIDIAMNGSSLDITVEYRLT